MRPRGVSTARIVAVFVVVALIAGLGLYFLAQGTRVPPPKSSTPSTTASGPFNATQAYLLHLENFANKTTCSFSQGCKFSLVALNDYTDSSEITWLGNSGGLNGNYSGMQQIQLLYQTMNAVAQYMNITILSLTPSGNSLSLKFNVTGFSYAIGGFNGTIKATASYANANGNWFIQKEVWDYTYFIDQNTGGATTFPQWRSVGGPIAETKSPDPFKQFVYDYGGGGVTIAIFSFIAALAVLQATKRWR